jgi:hypothetical protein
LHHADLHEAVIEEQYVADRDVLDQVVIIHGDRIPFRVFCATYRDFQNITDHEREVVLQYAGANRRSLRVEKERDIAPELLGKGADPRDDVTHPFMLRVAHVQPKHVGARLDHLPDNCGIFRGWTESADDLGLAHRASGFRAEIHLQG